MTVAVENPEKPWSYLAILKGRRGEYAALRDLDAATLAAVTPLIQLWSRQGDQAAVADMAVALKDMRTGWGPEPLVLLDGAWMVSSGGFWRALEAAMLMGAPRYQSVDCNDDLTTSESSRGRPLNGAMAWLCD